jgi:L-alanine-DL-glutamate epimerase-like enolase superfamily enzyme
LSSLIQVHTDENVSGVGSVYSHPGLIRYIVESHLRDLLVGEDPRNVQAVWDRAYKATRWYGRKGGALSAIGGIDTALWDIRGKLENKPIYQLLGGVRDRVPAYASSLLWKAAIQELQTEACRHVAAGFRAMKTRLGRNSEYDRSAIRALREAVGNDVEIMVDGNGRYSLDQARRIAQDLQKYRAYWFEEPFPPEDHDSLQALHSEIDIPLAAGENEFGMQGFRELVDKDLVDIIQPDCSRCGGISEAQQIGQYGARFDRKVATHTWNDAVALVANLHLVASLSNGIYVEIDQTGIPLIDELLIEPLRLIDGEVIVPQGPGLGIELRQDTLDRLTVPADQPFPPGNYSDLVFGHNYLSSTPPYEAEV